MGNRHRSVLRESASRSPISAWMQSNPEAHRFVEAWVEMRQQGDTTWGAGRVVRYLRSEFGYPFRSDFGLLRWVNRELEGH